MDKSANRVALYEEHVRRIRERGIMINGSFVFGFDGDDAEVFDQTVDWARRCKVDTATFHILTPYPGTPLFARLDREGRITDRDWRRYDTAHVVFHPKQMSAAELQAGYERAYDRFYTWPAIAQRVAGDRWARLARLLLNVGYKRMNPLWPVLGRCRMASAPFGLFVGALQRHRRAWQWRRSNAGAAAARPAERTLEREASNHAHQSVRHDNRTRRRPSRRPRRAAGAMAGARGDHA